ncbi:MAG: mechanosensitive ion channel [Gemmatimonadetes bacterium]|nr:mechanosensitive ion channel [Gemmatimonadota bacterium]
MNEILESTRQLAPQVALESGQAAILLGLAWLGYYVARNAFLRVLERLIRRSRTDLDEILLGTGVLRRSAMLVPAAVLFYGAEIIPGPPELTRQIMVAVLGVLGLLIGGSLLSAFDLAYGRLPVADKVPIRSYVQITRIALYVVGSLVVVALTMGRSPLGLLGGIGAMTAVVLLIFRDTILSLVASIQIHSQNLVDEGDWIEAPTFGADGDVIDISLHTIQVQNWDKTITTIPTPKLIDASFKNWRGMKESGGRRIKRSLYIDMQTIRICSDEMLERYGKFELIREYLRERRREVAEYNDSTRVDTSQLINGRRLTNVGTFRAYVTAYLRNHPRIRQDLTFLVRQLQPGDAGLPIEIYVFTNDTVWANYEAIQADIFDHLIAVVPQFDLRVFQQPAGADFRALAR